MMNANKIKYFQTQKMTDSQWSFGACLSSSKFGDVREVYLFINFFKWSFVIGRFLSCEEEEE